MKADKILVKTITTIAMLLVVALVFYFSTVKTSHDGSWNHTYFPGSVLFFCVIGLIGFFIQKKKERLSKKYNPYSPEEFSRGMIRAALLRNPKNHNLSTEEMDKLVEQDYRDSLG